MGCGSYLSVREVELYFLDLIYDFVDTLLKSNYDYIVSLKSRSALLGESFVTLPFDDVSDDISSKYVHGISLVFDTSSLSDSLKVDGLVLNCNLNILKLFEKICCNNVSEMKHPISSINSLFSTSLNIDFMIDSCDGCMSTTRYYIYHLDNIHFNIDVSNYKFYTLNNSLNLRFFSYADLNSLMESGMTFINVSGVDGVNIFYSCECNDID